jgi:hypothetical protein
VAEVRNDAGTPIVNAKVGLMGAPIDATPPPTPPPTPAALNLWLDSSHAAVVYETVSNAEGQITLPIRVILSDVLELKITEGDLTFYARVKIPSDVAKDLSQRRVDEGLSQLPNYPAMPSISEPTSATPEQSLERKISLQLPKNRIEPISTDSQNAEEPVLITALSLPYTPASDTKKIDIFPQVVNASVANSFRFNWQNAFSDAAEVRIAYSFSEDAISGWDGKVEDVAGLSSSRSGIDVVTNYEACTDPDYRTSTSGNITSVHDGKCGFLSNQFPFNDGADVFVRLSGESATEIKLSPVFRWVFNNTPPSLSPIANKKVFLDATPIDVPLNLNDAETQLDCRTALSAQSSNVGLIANNAILIGGIYPSCKLTLYPKAEITGNSVITVSATDGSLVAIQEFAITIASVPVAPPVVQSGLLLQLDASVLKSYSGTGNTWYDLSGNGNDATLINSPTFTTDSGGALEFNGSNYVDSLNVSSYENLTIEMWMYDTRPNDGGEQDVLTYNGNLGSYTFTGGVFKTMGDNTWARMIYGTGYQPKNQWYRFVYIKNGNLWINNTQYSSGQWGDAAYGSLSFANTRSGLNYRFSGKIAAIAVYGRSLNDDELLQNFNLIKERFGL